MVADSSLHSPKQRFAWVDPFLVATLLQNEPGLTLLESSNQFLGVAGRSFLAVCPDRLIQTTVSELDELEHGCWAGWLGYDLGRQIEKVSAHAAKDRPIPPFALARYPAWITFDHHHKVTYVHGNEKDSKKLIEAVRCALHTTRTASPPANISLDWKSTFSREQYQAIVSHAVERIHAGDLSQVNLSQRFSAAWSSSPFDLYASLREHAPAPFMGLVRLAGIDVLSTSPELFLRRRQKQLVTRPIKGTAPRRTTRSADHASAVQLAESQKNRSENTMIVDLARNDLGRVCEYGSVTVPGLCELESHSAVHHLVSTVKGTLKPDVSVREIIAATFPPGSVVGTPKIQAMQLIDQLEPVRRGVYCGSLAWFEPNGNFDLSVAIRTLVAHGEIIDLHVGGAVVADSNPQAEWQETLDKAQAVFAATQPEKSLHVKL